MLPQVNCMTLPIGCWTWLCRYLFLIVCIRIWDLQTARWTLYRQMLPALCWVVVQCDRA